MDELRTQAMRMRVEWVCFGTVSHEGFGISDVKNSYFIAEAAIVQKHRIMASIGDEYMFYHRTMIFTGSSFSNIHVDEPPVCKAVQVQSFTCHPESCLPMNCYILINIDVSHILNYAINYIPKPVASYITLSTCTFFACQVSLPTIT